MGMNAIAIYVLAEGDIIDAFLGQFYWATPDQSLTNWLWPTGVYWGDDPDDDALPTTYPANVPVLCWTIGYIVLWMIVSWVMHRKKIYFKI
jgi:hypothetical protein